MESHRRSGDGKSLFRRQGPASGKGQPDRRDKVCYNWKAGRCYRHPCPFLHLESPATQDSNRFVWRRPGTGGSGAGQNGGLRGRDDTDIASSKGGAGTGQAEKPCKYFLLGNCTCRDRCRFLHSWSVGDAPSLMTSLKGHQKVISAIQLPSGSNKLYSGSMDGTVMEWDCHTGQCAANVSMGAEVGSMIIEEPWLFVGIPDLIKVWNTQTGAEMSLPGPIGQVYALVAANDMLFAGAQDGRILVWRCSATTNSFEPATALLGHRLAVISLVVGGSKVYSASMDNTIKAWDLTTLQCDQTLPDHTNVVMSLLCWDQFLLSGSLDKTIKVWVMNEKNQLEVTYNLDEQHGVLTMCGMHDSHGKPILLVALNDHTVRIYDLPSFHMRGVIYSMLDVKSMAIGPGGLLFTGDGSGELRVWQWPTGLASNSNRYCA